jgi:TolB protein
MGDLVSQRPHDRLRRRQRPLPDECRRHGEANFASWSPDSTRIVYQTRRGAIYVINADGTGREQLLTGVAHNEGNLCPTWSPDGTHLAFSRGLPDYTGIVIYDLGGREARLLTRHGYSESGFAWTPDSRAIVYARENQRGVYAINIDGTGDHRLTRNPVRADLSVGGFAYSGDGRQIAYASNATGRGDIYVMDADGTRQRQLTTGPELDGAPVWSHSPYAGSC